MKMKPSRNFSKNSFSSSTSQNLPDYHSGSLLLFAMNGNSKKFGQNRPFPPLVQNSSTLPPAPKTISKSFSRSHRGNRVHHVRFNDSAANLPETTPASATINRPDFQPQIHPPDLLPDQQSSVQIHPGTLSIAPKNDSVAATAPVLPFVKIASSEPSNSPPYSAVKSHSVLSPTATITGEISLASTSASTCIAATTANSTAVKTPVNLMPPPTSRPSRLSAHAQPFTPMSSAERPSPTSASHSGLANQHTSHLVTSPPKPRFLFPPSQIRRAKDGSGSKNSKDTMYSVASVYSSGAKVSRSNSIANCFRSSGITTISADTATAQPSTENNPTNSPNLLPGLSFTTKLIDLQFAQLGTLVGFAPSVKFIRDNYVARVRKIFVKYYGGLSRDKANLLLWKKVLLLPAILFSSSDRKDLASRIDLLLQDQWDTFTLSLLRGKNLPITPRDKVFEASSHGELPAAEWTKEHLRARACIEARELGKAMSIINARPTPHTSLSPDEKIQVLQSKHPPALEFRTTGFSQDTIDYIENCEVDADTIISATMPEVRDIIRKARKMIAHGADMLRYEHLKQLVGEMEEPKPAETEFCDLLCDLINTLLAGEVPTAVLPAFRDNHLLGIPKSDHDLRPIGMGSVYRKIAASIGFKRAAAEFNTKHFNTKQLALTQGGCEQIVHAFQVHMDDHPDHDLFCIDADNAFNSANRYMTLLETLQNFAGLYPFMRDMYKDPSNGFVFGHPSRITSVISEEGLHQGDVLGTWGYIMAIQPMLEDLHTQLRSKFGDEVEALVKFYVDDGNIAAPHHVMLFILDFLRAEGPKYGYKIKPTKGKYLLGSCLDLEEAKRRKQALVEKGLSPSIIVLHPSDDSGVATLEYGVKMLGSYVGHDDFIEDQLRDYCVELHHSAEALIAYPDLQGRWLLFQKCFLAKPIYMFRTICVHLACRQLDEKVEELKMMILRSLLGFGDYDNLDDVTYSTCNLPIAMGGLGLHDFSDLSRAAHISSMIAFAQSDT